MKVVEIQNFWKKLNILKQCISIAIKMNDFWALTDLTETENKLKRKDVKEVIALKRDRAWYLDQIQKGNKPIHCQQCNKHHFAKKTCYAYKFTKQGPPDIVISQSPSSVQMRAIPVQFDLNKLKE